MKNMKHSLRFFGIAAILALLFGAAHAQTNGLTDYNFSTGVDAAKWLVVGSSTNIGVDGDGESSDLQSIGFSFPFGDNFYTTFAVSDDGHIRLGSQLEDFDYQTPLSSGQANNDCPKIIAWGADGQFDASYNHIYTSNDGSKCIIDMLLSVYGEDDYWLLPVQV